MLISVIVPVYKVEKYIHRCVDSVLNQTFTDFELILVDDGSPDNCGAICDEYALKDNRIYVIHKENGGLSDARNAGIDWAFEHSDSEWISFIDSDDWVHPRYLEALYNAVIESGCSISVCGYKETTGEVPIVDETQLQSKIVNTEQFFCENNVNAIVSWGKLYKKDFFNNIRYPVGKLHEDEYTTYKMLFLNSHFSFISQPLYFYFMNSDSITQSKWTPKRLDSIYALYDRTIFFKKRHLRNAYLFSLKHTMANLWINYNCINESDCFDGSYISIVKKNMRKTLLLAKKDKVFPINKYKNYYSFAFPVIFKCTRKIRSAKKKITHLVYLIGGINGEY